MTSDLTGLLSLLVAADSVNPSLVAGGAGESEIAKLIEGWARDAGLESERLEDTPGRPSVLVRARGAGGGRTLLLCGHIDTVNVEGMSDPHTPRIDGDRLYGRGAYDMKAGVAAALIAAREASRLGLAGDVVVAAVADGEHASLGVDAILKIGAVLNGLEQLDRSLADRTHALLGRASVHASLIEGGVELSSYPAQCKLGLERRTLPGETGAQIEAELAGLLERCREKDPEFEATQRTLLVREPFEID